MFFSNSLIIHKVNYQPQDVYHITCMCLDTQWKTSYHSPVRVVYTTKICTMTTSTKLMNIYYSEVSFYNVSPFVFKVTPIRVASFISASKTCRNVTNLRKRKKKVVLKTMRTSSLCEPNFIPKKCNLPLVGHVQRVQCSTSIYIRKVALQSANNRVQLTGRITFPRRIVYFLNELWQPVVATACTLSSKSFVVKRPLGSKVQDFTNRCGFHSSKTLHDHLAL